MTTERAKDWRRIAERIERDRNCGPHGLCYYLTRTLCVVESNRFSMKGQLESHVLDNLRQYESAANDGDPLYPSRAYLDKPGVWETRVLLAYFLALEAEDE